MIFNFFNRSQYLPLDKKALFIYALKNPDDYTYLIFQAHWEKLEERYKKQILAQYKKNKLQTMSELIICNRKILNAHMIMKYLLSSGFEFNKKDKSRLSSHTWSILENFLSGKKKTIKNKKVVIINNISTMLNKDMVKVLAGSFDKLPQDLRKRVKKQSDSEDLLRIYEMDMGYSDYHKQLL